MDNVNGFMNVLRGIIITLCDWIYPLIPKLYSVFYYLAESRFFDSQLIKDFSNNIYVLVSVVMLFTFGVKLLQVIVNPDLLWDSKKGFTGVLKRVFIALFLIIIIPFAFDAVYEIQEYVISNSLIEKLLVGIQTSDNNIAESTNAGQVLAGITISGLLYPNEDATTTSDSLQSNYNTMLNEDIGYISKVGKNINETYVNSNGDTDYVLNFNGLIALITGIVIVYLFVLFCFDTAFRFVKLAFLELTAPISIMAYIYNGDEFLSKWYKETLSTFIGLFIRVAALGLLIFGVHQLPTFMEQFGDIKGKFLIQLFVIIGLLTFVKAAPDLVKTITGISVKGGGINRRLGEMAGVGTIAQNAWKGLKGIGVTALGAGAAGIAVAGSSAARGIDNKLFNGKGRELVNKVKNSQAVEAITAGGSALKASYNAGGGVKSLSAAKKAWKESDYAKMRASNVALKNAAADNERYNKIARSYGLNESGYVDKGTAEISREKAYDTVSNHMIGVSSKARDAIINKGNMDMIKSEVDNIKNKKDDLVSIIDNSIKNASAAGNVRAQQILENFNGRIKNSDSLDLEAEKSNIQSFVDQGILSEAIGTDMLKKLTNIRNSKIKLEADIENLNLKDSKILKLADGSSTVNMGAIAGAITAAEAISQRAQKDIDSIKESSNQYAKNQIDQAIDAIDKINKQSVVDYNNYDYKAGKDFKFVLNNSSSSTTTSSSDENNQEQVENRIIQNRINNVTNVHNEPSRGEHNNMQDYYTRFFNDPSISNAIDRVENEFDEIKENQEDILENQRNSRYEGTNELKRNANSSDEDDEDKE